VRSEATGSLHLTTMSELSSTRGRLWCNQMSTESGEGQKSVNGKERRK